MTFMPKTTLQIGPLTINTSLRAFEYFDRTLHLGNRIEIQAWQSVKRPLLLMNDIIPGNNPRIEKAIDWTENRIISLQEDLYRFSPEFNEALAQSTKWNNRMFTFGAISPPIFFSFAHYVERGHFPVEFLPAAAAWIASAIIMERLGSQLLTKKMLSGYLNAEKAKIAGDLKLAEITDNIHDVVWKARVVDGLEFVYISPSIQKQLGLSEEEANNLIFGERLSPKSFALINKELAEGMEHLTNGAKEVVRVIELELRHNNGNYISTEMSAKLFLDPTGTPVVIGVSRDITDIKQAWNIAKTYEKKAAVGNTAAAIAHAMKNMLLELASNNDNDKRLTNRQNCLIDVLLLLPGNNSLGQNGSIDIHNEIITNRKEKAENNEQSCESLEYMEKMMRNMLSFSRIGSETKKAICIKKELLGIVQVLERFTMQKSIKLNLDLTNLEESDGINLPDNGLRDIIRNLVMNSSEAFDDAHSDKTMQINIIATKDKDDEVTISVEDNGPGMPASIRDKLFNEAVASSKIGGSGIGLSSVKGILDISGGTVDIVSELAKGTKISIRLPIVVFDNKISDRPNNHLPQITKEKAANYTIMLLDDMPSILKATENRLKNLGFEVKPFNDTEEAFKWYKNQKTKPDLVITDETMPNMNGHQFIQTIEQLSGSNNSRFAIYSGNVPSSDPKDPLKEAMNNGVHLIQKGVDLKYFDYVVTGIFASDSKESTNWKKEPFIENNALESNPTYLFIRRIIHDINNVMQGILFFLEQDIDSMDKLNDKVTLSEKTRSQLNRLLEMLADLRMFYKMAPELHVISDICKSKLPKSLTGERFIKEVWEKVPPKERIKLSLIASLYIQNGFEDICENIRNCISSPALSRLKADKLGKDLLIFVEKSNATALRGEREPLIEKFKEYYKILAIEPE